MSWQIPPAAPLPIRERAVVDGSPEVEALMLRALSLLDPALARFARAERRRAALLRFWRGITAHLSTRITEWVAAAFMLQLGWTLYTPPDVLPGQPAWAILTQILYETTWGMVMLTISALRVLALGVNGTYAGFRFSPHVRALTAFLGCGIWLQVVLSLWLSQVPGTALGTYRIILALECWNLWRAGLDVGYVERRRADAP
jgi:hypothetical protein